jgi:hypothetical protein
LDFAGAADRAEHLRALAVPAIRHFCRTPPM